MSDDLTTTYEIYVLRSGRWELHDSYEPEDAEKCVEDAKRLHKQARFEGVRVVEDTYDANTRRHSEENVYCSPIRQKAKPKASRANARPLKVRRAEEKPAPRTPLAFPRLASGAGRSMPKFAALSLSSLTVALLISYLFLLFLRHLETQDIALGNSAAKVALIAVFVISAVGLFVPLMHRFGPSLREPAAASQPADNPIAMPLGTGGLPQPPRPSAKGYPPPPGAGDEVSENEVDDDTGEEPAPEPPLPAGGAEAELLKFIGDALEPLAGAGRSLDAYNRFGLTLFFAGAAEYLASRDGVPRDAMQAMLVRQAQLLGHSPEMARGFCANIDEYLINAKYFEMYEAGRAAVVRHLKDPKGESGALAAMDFWNEPAAPGDAEVREFVAILFTDIVGSTAMTQARGDAGAQQVVRAHNQLVREALALHGGKEIKHTGDGIMASFPQVTDAVDGAIAIQQACARANAADPELGLGICIGINAGEPIHESGDIFGTPVQMAARVLSKAEGGEIAVSNLVREMCVGKEYAVAKKGDYELKGFAEPVPIFLVQWQPVADADALPAEAMPA